eukprot:10288170-Ditylum_brightwellii.AAC.1
MSAKDDKIKELGKSIDQLNLTIQAFANKGNDNGSSFKNQGKQNTKRGGKGGPIAIHYCWTCGLNTTHAGKDCTCKK